MLFYISRVSRTYNWTHPVVPTGRQAYNDQVDMDNPIYRKFFNLTTKFGLTNYLLMNKSEEPRPLYEFFMRPWKYENISWEKDGKYIIHG